MPKSIAVSGLRMTQSDWKCAGCGQGLIFPARKIHLPSWNDAVLYVGWEMLGIHSKTYFTANTICCIIWIHISTVRQDSTAAEGAKARKEGEIHWI